MNGNFAKGRTFFGVLEFAIGRQCYTSTVTHCDQFHKLSIGHQETWSLFLSVWRFNGRDGSSLVFVKLRNVRAAFKETLPKRHPTGGAQFSELFIFPGSRKPWWFWRFTRRWLRVAVKILLTFPGALKVDTPKESGICRKRRLLAKTFQCPKFRYQSSTNKVRSWSLEMLRGHFQPVAV